MNTANEYLINCVVTNKTGVVVQQFTIDYNDPNERRYLGQQCATAIYAGHKVTTWPENPARRR